MTPTDDSAFLDGRPRPPLEEIINQVKQTILLVQKVTTDPVGATIDRVDISLKTVVDDMKGVGLKLSIPILGDLEAGGGITQSQIQTISLSFNSIDTIKTFESDNIELKLSSAIFSVRDAVRAALGDEPKFQLAEAVI